MHNDKISQIKSNLNLNDLNSDNSTIKNAAIKLQQSLVNHENIINDLKTSLEDKKKFVNLKRNEVLEIQYNLNKTEKNVTELKEKQKQIDNIAQNSMCNNIKNNINNLKDEIIDLKQELEIKYNEVINEENDLKKLERYTEKEIAKYEEIIEKIDYNKDDLKSDDPDKKESAQKLLKKIK